GSALVFYDVAYDEVSKGIIEPFRCPNATCGAELEKSKLERRPTAVRSAVGDTVETGEMKPVRIHYSVGKARYEKVPDAADLEVLARVARSPLAGPVPSHEIPFMHMTHERAPMPKKGYTNVHHLWGDRALH